ncbi:MAG: hypothetical protein EON54_11045 [Alcaligenaceae bacterium]|nr:MAG: hypothetical protein EON54_11045 [Alcaligenaceae bacterium]
MASHDARQPPWILGPSYPSVSTDRDQSVHRIMAFKVDDQVIMTHHSPLDSHTGLPSTAEEVAMQGIGDWLVSLGLGQYAQRFADSEIDTIRRRSVACHGFFG